jgi:DNA-binding transcriptional MerR regulator
MSSTTPEAGVRVLEPAVRTARGTGRYSADDLVRLRRIKDLLDAGLNLAGIAMVLGLESDNAQLQAEKREHQWLSSGPIRQQTSPAKRKSKNASGRRASLASSGWRHLIRAGRLIAVTAPRSLAAISGWF